MKAMDTKQEKYVYLGFKSISNPFREKFIKYPNLEKKTPVSNFRVS